MHCTNQDAKSHAMAKTYYIAIQSFMWYVGIGNPSPFSTSCTQFMTFTEMSLKLGYRHEFVFGEGGSGYLVMAIYRGNTLIKLIMEHRS